MGYKRFIFRCNLTRDAAAPAPGRRTACGECRRHGTHQAACRHPLGAIIRLEARAVQRPPNDACSRLGRGTRQTCLSHTRAAPQKGRRCLAGRAQPPGPLCWPCFDPAPQSSSSTAVVQRVSSTVAAGHCTSSECDVQAAPVTGEWAGMTYSSVPLRFTAGRSLQRLQNTTSASLPHHDAAGGRS